MGFQKCSEIACTNRFIVTLVAFKHFFSEGVFNCPLETPASTDAKSHWLHLFDFSPRWVFKCLFREYLCAVELLHWLHPSCMKQLDLSDGLWPSHHLTDVEQPSKTIKYEGIPKNHQQTIEHDGYPQPFHSKVIVALRTIKKDANLTTSALPNIQNFTEKIKKTGNHTKTGLALLNFQNLTE